MNRQGKEIPLRRSNIIRFFYSSKCCGKRFPCHTRIRKLLKTRLQHRMQLWDELNDGATEEALFLKLLCEDKEEIPADAWPS